MAKKKKGWAGKREKIENIRTEDHTLCIPRPFSASRRHHHGLPVRCPDRFAVHTGTGKKISRV